MTLVCDSEASPLLPALPGQHSWCWSQLFLRAALRDQLPQPCFACPRAAQAWPVLLWHGAVVWPVVLHLLQGTVQDSVCGFKAFLGFFCVFPYVSWWSLPSTAGGGLLWLVSLSLHPRAFGFVQASLVDTFKLQSLKASGTSHGSCNRRWKDSRILECDSKWH